MDFSQDITCNDQAGTGRLAVLLDPEKTSPLEARKRVEVFQESGVDCLFIGSTFLPTTSAGPLLLATRRHCDLSIILFPGASTPERSLAPGADGFLCPIVLTSRDPRYLIDWHIEATPLITRLALRPFPTGYILVGLENTSAAAIRATNSTPVPHTSLELAATLASTAAILGMSLVYLDAGSGAEYPVSPEMISTVRSAIALPLLVGGGLRDPNSVASATKAGANMVLIGNALEKFDRGLLCEMVAAAQTTNTSQEVPR